MPDMETEGSAMSPAGLPFRLGIIALAQVVFFVGFFPDGSFRPLQKLAIWLILDLASAWFFLRLLFPEVTSRLVGAFSGLCVGGLFLWGPIAIPDLWVMAIVVLSPLLGHLLWKLSLALKKRREPLQDHHGLAREEPDPKIDVAGIARKLAEFRNRQ